MDMSQFGRLGGDGKREFGKFPPGMSYWLLVAPLHWPHPGFLCGLHRIGLNPTSQRENMAYCLRYATPPQVCPACEAHENARQNGHTDLANVLKATEVMLAWMLPMDFTMTQTGPSISVKGPPCRMEIKGIIARQIQHASKTGLNLIDAHRGYALLSVERTGTGRNGTRYNATICDHLRVPAPLPDSILGSLAKCSGPETSDLAGFPSQQDMAYLTMNGTWPPKNQQQQAGAPHHNAVINPMSTGGGGAVQPNIQMFGQPQTFSPGQYAQQPAAPQQQQPPQQWQPPPAQAQPAQVQWGQPQAPTQQWQPPAPQPAPQAPQAQQPPAQPQQAGGPPKCYGTVEFNPAEEVCRGCQYQQPCSMHVPKLPAGAGPAGATQPQPPAQAALAQPPPAPWQPQAAPPPAPAQQWQPQAQPAAPPPPQAPTQPAATVPWELPQQPQVQLTQQPHPQQPQQQPPQQWQPPPAQAQAQPPQPQPQQQPPQPPAPPVQVTQQPQAPVSPQMQSAQQELARFQQFLNSKSS